MSMDTSSLMQAFGFPQMTAIRECEKLVTRALPQHPEVLHFPDIGVTANLRFHVYDNRIDECLGPELSPGGLSPLFGAEFMSGRGGNVAEVVANAALTANYSPIMSRTQSPHIFGAMLSPSGSLLHGTTIGSLRSGAHGSMNGLPINGLPNCTTFTNLVLDTGTDNPGLNENLSKETRRSKEGPHKETSSGIHGGRSACNSSVRYETVPSNSIFPAPIASAPYYKTNSVGSSYNAGVNNIGGSPGGTPNLESHKGCFPAKSSDSPVLSNSPFIRSRTTDRKAAKKSSIDDRQKSFPTVADAPLAGEYHNGNGSHANGSHAGSTYDNKNDYAHGSQPYINKNSGANPSYGSTPAVKVNNLDSYNRQSSHNHSRQRRQRGRKGDRKGDRESDYYENTPNCQDSWQDNRTPARGHTNSCHNDYNGNNYWNNKKGYHRNSKQNYRECGPYDDGSYDIYDKAYDATGWNKSTDYDTDYNMDYNNVKNANSFRNSNNAYGNYGKNVDNYSNNPVEKTPTSSYHQYLMREKSGGHYDANDHAGFQNQQNNYGNNMSGNGMGKMNGKGSMGSTPYAGSTPGFGNTPYAEPSYLGNTPFAGNTPLLYGNPGNAGNTPNNQAFGTSFGSTPNSQAFSGWGVVGSNMSTQAPSSMGPDMYPLNSMSSGMGSMSSMNSGMNPAGGVNPGQGGDALQMPGVNFPIQMNPMNPNQNVPMNSMNPNQNPMDPWSYYDGSNDYGTSRPYFPPQPSTQSQGQPQGRLPHEQQGIPQGKSEQQMTILQKNFLLMLHGSRDTPEKKKQKRERKQRHHRNQDQRPYNEDQYDPAYQRGANQHGTNQRGNRNQEKGSIWARGNDRWHAESSNWDRDFWSAAEQRRNSTERGRKGNRQKGRPERNGERNGKGSSQWYSSAQWDTNNGDSQWDSNNKGGNCEEKIWDNAHDAGESSSVRSKQKDPDDASIDMDGTHYTEPQSGTESAHQTANGSASEARNQRANGSASAARNGNNFSNGKIVPSKPSAPSKASEVKATRHLFKGEQQKVAQSKTGTQTAHSVPPSKIGSTQQNPNSPSSGTAVGNSVSKAISNGSPTAVFSPTSSFPSGNSGKIACPVSHKPNCTILTRSGNGVVDNGPATGALSNVRPNSGNFNGILDNGNPISGVLSNGNPAGGNTNSGNLNVFNGVTTGVSPANGLVVGGDSMKAMSMSPGFVPITTAPITEAELPRLELATYDTRRHCYYFRIDYNHDALQRIRSLKSENLLVGGVQNGGVVAGATQNGGVAGSGSTNDAILGMHGHVGTTSMNVLGPSPKQNTLTPSKQNYARRLVTFLRDHTGIRGTCGVDGKGVFEVAFYSEVSADSRCVSDDDGIVGFVPYGLGIGGPEIALAQAGLVSLHENTISLDDSINNPNSANEKGIDNTNEKGTDNNAGSEKGTDSNVENEIVLNNDGTGHRMGSNSGFDLSHEKEIRYEHDVLSEGSSENFHTRLRSFASEVCVKEGTYPLFSYPSYVSVAVLCAMPKPLQVNGRFDKLSKHFPDFFDRVLSYNGSDGSPDDGSNGTPFVRGTMQTIGTPVNRSPNGGGIILVGSKSPRQSSGQQPGQQSPTGDKTKSPTNSPGGRLNSKHTTSHGNLTLPIPSRQSSTPSGQAVGTTGQGNQATWEIWVRPDTYDGEGNDMNLLNGPASKDASLLSSDEDEEVLTQTQQCFQVMTEPFTMEGINGPLHMIFYPRGEPKRPQGSAMSERFSSLPSSPLSVSRNRDHSPATRKIPVIPRRHHHHHPRLSLQAHRLASPGLQVVDPISRESSPGILQSSIQTRDSPHQRKDTLLMISEGSPNHSPNQSPNHSPGNESPHARSSPNVGNSPNTRPKANYPIRRRGEAAASSDGDPSPTNTNADRSPKNGPFASPSPTLGVGLHEKWRSPLTKNAAKNTKVLTGRNVSKATSTYSKNSIRRIKGHRERKWEERNSKQSVVSCRTSSPSDRASPRVRYCAFFIRAQAGTRHAFALTVNDATRCASHTWDRESNWGFPVFTKMQSGKVKLQMEVIAPIPAPLVTYRTADWMLDSSLFHKAYFRSGEEIRSDVFCIGGYELQVFLYPQGSGGDKDYVSVFLKYSGGVPLSCHVTLDGIGPRGLCHDGNGIWGYPTFCPRSFLSPYLDPLDKQEEAKAMLDDYLAQKEVPTEKSPSTDDYLQANHIGNLQPGDLQNEANLEQDEKEDRKQLHVEVQKPDFFDETYGNKNNFVDNGQKVVCFQSRTGEERGTLAEIANVLQNSVELGKMPTLDNDLQMFRGRVIQNACSKRRTHNLRLRVEVISSAEKDAFKKRTNQTPSWKGRAVISHREVVQEDPRTRIRNREHARKKSSDSQAPTLLEVSQTLIEICNLPPAKTIESNRCMLWLGGDAASISRFLLCYYLNQLNCNLLYTPHAVESVDPCYQIVSVATGDDELLYMQDKYGAEHNADKMQRNNPATTTLRQHKFLQRLCTEHVDVPTYLRKRAKGCVDFKLLPLHEESIKEAVDQYPVVLKIPYSDSSCGVVMVDSSEDIGPALECTLGPANCWDSKKLPVDYTGDDEMATALYYKYEVPRLVILEPLLAGDEFVVNIVSCEGVHVISDAWTSACKKVESEMKRPLYDEQQLCDHLDDDLIDFCFQTLDRCGLVFGASHLEVIRCNKTGKVRLIELNARLAGDFPRAQDFYEFKTESSTFLKRFGVNQFSLLALASAKPQEFLAFARENERGLKLRDPNLTVCAVFLLADSDGRFLGESLADICSMTTFAGLRRALGHFPAPPCIHPLRLILNVHKGFYNGKIRPPIPRLKFPRVLGTTKKTVSLRSCPGVILLAGPRDIVSENKAEIRRLEETGLLYDPSTADD